MASDTYVDLYAFVADTAYYNRDFDNPGSVATVDQGVCCLTDRIRNMFGEVAFISDGRENRVDLPQISDVSTWVSADTTIKDKLSIATAYLNGKISLVYDAKKHTAEFNEAIKNNESVFNNLFSFIETLGYYQMFNSAIDVTTVSAAEAASRADQFVSGAGGATVDTSVTDDKNFSEVDVAYSEIYREGLPSETFKIGRYVRNSAVVWFDLTGADGKPIPVRLHLWWSSDKFVSEYPLSTITDVVLPCKPEMLYELLDNYKTVSAFAEASSRYRNDRINEIVAKDDHRGVYTFTTNYYAYPDTQPNNTFNLSFGVVYKGARPTIDQVKEALRDEILGIIPAHSEEEWRKKLPGIISERWFFMIPLYDNVWTGSDGVVHRYGIVDTTRFASIISKTLGQAYVEQANYAQLIIPKYSKYPVMVIPKLDNPAQSKLFSNVYKDYIGINVSTEDEEETLTSESPMTQEFTLAFNSALADAYLDRNAASVTDFTGLNFVPFNPPDGISYFVLTKRSFENNVK